MSRHPTLLRWRQPTPSDTRAHPFSDGNTRTAFVTMMTFFGRNDQELSATEVDVVQMMVALAGSEFTEAVLADWIRARVVPLSL